MGVKELLAYICFAGAAVSFVTLYLIPKIRRLREASQKTLGNSEEKASQAMVGNRIAKATNRGY